MAGTGTAHMRDGEDVLVRVENLVVEFPAKGGRKVHAVSDISFDIREGETLGLVGESGCGKSTTGRAIMQLPKPTSGSVRFDGVEMTTLGHEELRRTRTQLQMIFQDPISSLNPRRKVKDIVAEGLNIWGNKIGSFSKDRVNEVLDAVGLDPEIVSDRRPHQFSGGQCQRICIARALVLDPKVIICDEPVSALDVSVQAQILNLLQDMKARYGLTLIFIAHDLAVVKNVSDPAHPYTRILLASIPEPDPNRPIPQDAIAGDLPSPMSPPSGCRFRTRCPKAQDTCAELEPEIRQISDGHYVACHFPDATPVSLNGRAN
jgi:peptide/nickel transport system ATP-binding protein